MFLEECKYVVREKKSSKFITDDIEISSDDSDKEDSNEKTLIEKIKYKSIFRENIIHFLFLEARKFHFPKYKKFLRSGFAGSFLKCKKNCF